MSNYAISLKRTGLLLAALTFTALLMVFNLASFLGKADAAQLVSRSMTTTSSLAGTFTDTSPNTELNGADSTHTFTFEVGSNHTIRSVRFKYCDTAIGTCNAPTAVSVESGTALTVQTLEGTSFTTLNPYAIDGTVSDDDELCIDSATGNAVTTGSSQTLQFAFDDIRNPDTVAPYFVRITTYSAVDCATAVDDGTVATAVTTGIAITARVAETLGFSTTGAMNTTDVPAETTACVPLTGSGALFLGDPTEHTLNLSTAYDNYSAFRLYTNAANGVTVNYEGATLTKAGTAQTITAVNAGVAADNILSIEGTEQFGLGVDTFSGGNGAATTITSNSITGASNVNVTNVDSGANITGGQAGELVINTNYDEADGIIDTNLAEDAEFAFVPDTVSTIASASGYVECNTGLIRYLGNIAPTTEAGTYTTTIVYAAVPTF